jgi:predicted oxidoreductase
MIAHVPIGPTMLQSSRVVHGCMRMVGDGSVEAKRKAFAAMEAAVECGINHFDHADIYGRGACESLFGEFLRAHDGLRERLILTSKCGVRFKGDPDEAAPARYDFSAAHIERSVEGSLSRLGIGQLDILLLHRPDFLMNPPEIAEAFTRLHQAGKVAHFGVSNFSPSQVSMLQQACPFPLVMHQVEFNIHRVAPLYNGELDQCMERNIGAQSWCPLGGVAYPAWGSTLTDEQHSVIREELESQARRYGCPPETLMLAWILFHPANIFPVIGTTNAERVREAVNALDIPYTREDWYRLLIARVGKLP